MFFSGVQGESPKRYIAQFFPHSTTDHKGYKTIYALQARLTPYFHIDHPTRGALPGPYKKLPPISSSTSRTSPNALAADHTVRSNPTVHPLRHLALDLAVTLLRLSGDQNDSTGGSSAAKLARAINLAVGPFPEVPHPTAEIPADVKYWLQISSWK